MQSYKNKLVMNLIKNKPIKNILNLGLEKMSRGGFIDPFCGVHIENYFDSNIRQPLPYEKHSFDMVVSSNPIEIFSNPCHMYSELMRVSKSGLIINPSPVSFLIKNRQTDQHHDKYIFWTDTFSNSLCFMPYYSPIEIFNIDMKDADEMSIDKPYFLKDWYYWESINEFNIKMYIKEVHFEDYLDYELIFQNAVDESMKNTMLTFRYL